MGLCNICECLNLELFGLHNDSPSFQYTNHTYTNVPTYNQCLSPLKYKFESRPWRGVILPDEMCRSLNAG